MREIRVKGMTKYIGLAAMLLLLGLFWHWNLDHTLTTAQAAMVVGTPSTVSGLDSGSAEVSTQAGKVTLRYEIRANEVYISGYNLSIDTTLIGNPSDIRVDLVIPDQIQHGESGVIYPVVGIAAGTFKNFIYLQTITIPSTSNFRVIGAEAFYGCTALEGTLSLGSTLQEIDDRAFYGCSRLQFVNIPASVTLIGTGVFANCQRLEAINVYVNNPNYCSKDGILYSRNMEQLIQYPAGLSYYNSNYSIMEIPSPVKTIYSQAFEGCTSLRVISGMANTVYTIGEKAFYNCSNLAEVHFSDNISQIGLNAFTGCSPSLTLFYSKSNLVVDNYVRSYGLGSSANCTVKFYDGGTLLKTETVKQGQAATAPTNLEKSGYTLTWDKEFTNVQQNISVYAVWKQNLIVTFKDPHSGQVSQATTYYGGSVNAPDWKRSGYVLGWDNTSFNYVTKNMTVNAVWLVSMTDVVIKEEVPAVGETRTINNVTYQVTRNSVSDPRVKVVGCTKNTITKLVIPSTVAFSGINFKVTNIATSACRDLPELKTLEIGKHVTKINKYAFYHCPNLRTITIHSKKLTAVGTKAFSKIYIKGKVNVPNSYIKKYTTLLQDAGLSTSTKVY